MSQRGAKLLLNCFLYATAQTLCATCVAQTPDHPVIESSREPADASSAAADPAVPETKQPQNPNPQEPLDNTNPLGTTFLKHLVSDQKAIWTSQAQLR